jgi:hypothetical protein
VPHEEIHVSKTNDKCQVESDFQVRENHESK